MQYYTFELDEESQDLHTIITPFGKYNYLRLPMGLKCSPDISQGIMKMYHQTQKMLMSTLMMLVSSFFNDWNHHVNLLSAIFVAYAKMVLPLTNSNMNGPSKKLTGSVIGLHHKV
jgi:hypothetical protein